MNDSRTHLDEGIIGEYLDGTLDVKLRREVERHLDRCGACRDELQALRNVASLVRGLPLDGLGHDFTLRVLNRIERRRVRSVSLLSVLSGAVALFFVAGMLLAIVSATGAIKWGMSADGGSPVVRYWHEGWNAVSHAVGWGVRLTGGIALPQSTMVLVLAVLVVLGGFALIDSVVMKRILNNQQS